MTDLFTDIDKTLAEVEKIKNKLKEQISKNLANVKDAPFIKRLSDSPSCFVIKFSDLDNDWSAEHYDFKHQAEAIMKFIEKNSLERCVTELRFIKENSHWSSNQMRRNTGIYSFHKDFLKQIFS